jgi:hypothetical protein
MGPAMKPFARIILASSLVLAVGAASLLFVLIFQFRSIGVLIYYLRISEVESA